MERPTCALFLSIKNSVWITGNFQWRMERHVPEFWEKGTTLQGTAKLKNVLPGVPFDSFPLFFHLNFRNFSRTIRVLEICNYRNFRLDLLLAFGSRFHEHPAGMLREKLSWYTLKLLKSSNSKLLIGKGCSLPKKQEPLPSEPFAVAWTHIELTHPKTARKRRNLSHQNLNLNRELSAGIAIKL